MRKAMIASFAVHVAIVGLALPIARRVPRSAEPAETNAPDRWAGSSLELPGTPGSGGERLVDVSVAGDKGRGADEKNVAPTDRAAAPEPPPKAADPPPVNTAAPPPQARDPKPAKDEPSPPPPKPKPKKRKAPEPPADQPGDGDAEANAQRPQKKQRPGGEAGSGDDGAGPRGGSDSDAPGAPRDLGRAFTRAVPAACQADPAWAALKPGDAGAIEVVFEIDETGHITGWKPKGDDPPRVLASLVRRTVALLDSSTFALRRGAVSRGSETLRVRAILSDVSTDESGGAAGLAFEYGNKKGRAAFTQPGGRHVEVRIEVIRVDERKADP